MPKMRKLLFIPLFVMGGMSILCQQTAATAAETSHAPEIVQYVREDKVYLLENIRREITKPSEKTVVEALLTEDGPKAAKLYRKQLDDYPDPQIDPISRSRLADYEQATATRAGLPVMPANASSSSKPPLAGLSQNLPASGSRPDSSMKRLPSPKPKPAAQLAVSSTSIGMKKDTTVQSIPAPARPKPSLPVTTGSFTLQFGSFDSITNAEQLTAQLSPNAPASVQEINGIYKVRLRRTFATRQEAAAFARTLPIESFVVSLQP